MVPGLGARSSFGPQRLHWIDPRIRTAGARVPATAIKRNEKRYHRVRKRIERPYAEKHALQRTPYRQCKAYSEKCPDERRCQPSLQHVPQKIDWASAERQPNSELGRAQSDTLGDNSLDSDCGQSHSDTRKDRQQHRAKFPTHNASLEFRSIVET